MDAVQQSYTRLGWTSSLLLPAEYVSKSSTLPPAGWKVHVHLATVHGPPPAASLISITAKPLDELHLKTGSGSLLLQFTLVATRYQ